MFRVIKQGNKLQKVGTIHHISEILEDPQEPIMKKCEDMASFDIKNFYMNIIMASWHVCQILDL